MAPAVAPVSPANSAPVPAMISLTAPGPIAFSVANDSADKPPAAKSAPKPAAASVPNKEPANCGAATKAAIVPSKTLPSVSVVLLRSNTLVVTSPVSGSKKSARY